MGAAARLSAHSVVLFVLRSAGVHAGGEAPSANPVAGSAPAQGSGVLSRHVTREPSRHSSDGDLYVFPSIHESYGLTLLEALSAGLPQYVSIITGAPK